VSAVRREVTNILDAQGLLGETGRAICSGWDSWRPGPYLLLGVNPGGRHPQTIAEHLDEVQDHWSAYTSETPHPAVRQQAVNIANVLVGAVEDLPSSNVVFIKSKNLETLRATHGNIPRLFDRCWPVLQWMLRTVRPKFILSMGMSNDASAYGLLARRSHPGPTGWSQHDDVGMKSCRVILDLGDGTTLTSNLIGFPHATRNGSTGARWDPSTQLPRLRELVRG